MVNITEEEKLKYYILINLIRYKKYNGFNLEYLFTEIPNIITVFNWQMVWDSITTLKKEGLVERVEHTISPLFRITEKGEKDIIHFELNKPKIYQNLIAYFPDIELKNRVSYIEHFIFYVLVGYLSFLFLKPYGNIALGFNLESIIPSGLLILFTLSVAASLIYLFSIIESPLNLHIKSIKKYLISMKWITLVLLVLGILYFILNKYQGNWFYLSVASLIGSLLTGLSLYYFFERDKFNYRMNNLKEYFKCKFGED